MNKHMKCIGFILLTIALVMGGCSKKEEAAESPSASKQTSQTTEAPEVTTKSTESKSLEDVFKKAALLKSYSYEMSMKSSMGSFKTQFWLQDDNMKTVSETPQGTAVTIVTKDKMITYDPGTKMGMSYKMDLSDSEAFIDEQEQVTIDASKNFKILSEETVNGYPCFVLNVSDEGMGEGKIWVSKEYGIMVKMIVKEAATGENMEMNIKNIKVGSLPTDTFKVPSDIKIIESGEYPVGGQ